MSASLRSNSLQVQKNFSRIPNKNHFYAETIKLTDDFFDVLSEAERGDILGNFIAQLMASKHSLSLVVPELVEAHPKIEF